MSIKFPKQFKSKSSGVIVEFISMHTGTVVKGNEYNKIGTYKRDWAPCTSSSNWEPIDSTTEEDITPTIVKSKELIPELGTLFVLTDGTRLLKDLEKRVTQLSSTQIF